MLTGAAPFYDRDQRMLFRKILYHKVEYPDYLSPKAKLFLEGLLQKNPVLRLGAGGINELKNHLWLKGTNWEGLLRKEISAPFVPRFTHEGDASNFLVSITEDKNSIKDQADYGNIFDDF